MSTQYELAANTLTLLQRRVLRAMAEASTTVEIARAAKLDWQTTRNTLTWLVAKGLVVRDEKWVIPSDERVYDMPRP